MYSLRGFYARLVWFVAGILVALCMTAAPAPAQAPRPSVLFLQWPGLQREMAQALVDNGLNVAYGGDTSPQRLRQFNAVVLLQGGASGPLLDNLIQYVQDGGGLFICSWKGENISDFDDQFTLLDRLDIRLRPESIQDPATGRSGVGPWGLQYALTTNIPRSPVSKGVRQIWYPTGFGAGGLSATLPYDPGAEWQVVLSGSAKAHSSPVPFGKALPAARITTQGIPSAPPIMAIRAMGKGRIAACGINASYHFAGGLARALQGATIGEGLDGKPSDLLPLLINTLQWISAPSLAAGSMGGARTPPDLLAAPKLPAHAPVDWSKLSFGPAPRTFRGIVGARTALSTGEGTVADYAAAARAAGLDFIVFLEDFRSLPRNKWDALVKECAAASTDKFLAVPGFTIEDGYGDHYFAAGDRIRYPEDDLLDAQRRLLTTSVGASDVGGGKPGQAGITLLEWTYNRNSFNLTFGSYLHTQNPCPFYDFRDYDAVALFTQDFMETDPALLNSLGDGYLALEGRGESLWPFAVTLLRRPADVTRVARQGYLNVFEAKDLPALSRQFDSWHSSVSGQTNLRVVTNGPQVLDWSFIGSRDYECYNWFRYSYWRWRPRLVAHSDAGLKQITIYNGPAILRRFYPAGAHDFTWEEDLSHGQQHNLVAWIEDVSGHQAVTNELFDRPQPLIEEFMCGDRNNQLSYSMQRRPDGTGAQSGFTMGMTPNKGPWNCEAPPLSTYKPDSQLGGAIPGFDGAPGGDPDFWLNPDLQSDAGAESVTRCRMKTARLLDSADLMMGQGETDGLYPDDVEALNVWHTLAPTHPTRLMDVRVRRTYFNIRPGLDSSILLDCTITFKQALKVTSLSLGTFGSGSAKGWAFRTEAGQTFSSEKSPKALDAWRTVSLTGGAYAAWCDAAPGSVALFNLGPQPVQIALKSGSSWQVSAPVDGKSFPAGAEIRVRLLLIGAPFTTPGNSDWVSSVAAAVGLSGQGYQPVLTAGKILSNRYVLEADGAGHGIAGHFPKATLPLALPVVVSKLCDRWSVYLYDRTHGVARPLGQFDGAAYATLDPADGDADLVIGHPVLGTDTAVDIGVVQTAPDALAVTVHNPTPEMRDCTVRPNPQWVGWRLPVTLLKLKPGECHVLIMRKTAPG